METLARRVLRNPVEIVVGGRSVTAGEIDQFVEVFLHVVACHLTETALLLPFMSVNPR